MTIAQMASIVGKKAVLSLDKDLSIEVVVRDVKQAFGRTDYSVEPVAGSGRKWVSADRVKLND